MSLKVRNQPERKVLMENYFLEEIEQINQSTKEANRKAERNSTIALALSCFSLGIAFVRLLSVIMELLQ